MKMNILKRWGLVLCGLCACFACSQEEALEPSDNDVNYFLVPDGATDAELVLRKKFWEDTGVHLLFTDTLHKEYVGKDGYGEDVWNIETVDFNYFMNSGTLDAEYSFGYLETMESKQVAVDFVQEHVLSHLSGDLLPYSILPLSTIDVYEYNSDEYDTDWWSYYTRMGWRCLALALDGIDQMDEAGKTEYARTLCTEIVTKILDDAEYATFAAFRAYSYDYYGMDKEDLGVPNGYDDEQAREFGFLEDYKRTWYIYGDTDLEEYIDATLSMSEEEFTEMYGTYPVIMAKYKELKKIIESFGYKF